MLHYILATREYQLAWRLADSLRVPAIESTITVHWCRALIHEAPAALADVALLEQLWEKLTIGCAWRARIAQVAEAAHRVGRVGLAMLLLDEFECKTAHEVPLLLSMGELPRVLTKAVGCADVELIHLVLLHAKSSLAEAEFLEFVLPQRVAQELLAVFCRACAVEVVHRSSAAAHPQRSRLEPN